MVQVQHLQIRLMITVMDLGVNLMPRNGRLIAFCKQPVSSERKALGMVICRPGVKAWVWIQTAAVVLQLGCAKGYASPLVFLKTMREQTVS